MNSMSGNSISGTILRLAYMLKSVWAILAALVVGAGLVLLAGANPIDTYAALFSGAFLDYYGLGSTLVRMSPLLLAGLAVIVPLRAGLFNIGGEGQIYIGALFGTVAALYLPDFIPAPLAIVLTILAGALGGALWALIPALLRAYRGVNEIITSLLMSHVAIYAVGVIIHSWLMEPGAPYPYSREIAAERALPVFMPQTQAHLGILLSVVAALVLALVMKRSTLGQSIEIVGHNPTVATYSGLGVRRLIVTSFLIGGAMAGLAGTFEVIGLKYRLFDHFSPGYGLQGIIVAFLAGLSPLFAVLAALFLAGLQSGAGIMQRAVGVDTTMVEALQGLIVLFVAIGLAFRYRPGRRAAKAPAVAAQAEKA